MDAIECNFADFDGRVDFVASNDSIGASEAVSNSFVSVRVSIRFGRD